MNITTIILVTGYCLSIIMSVVVISQNRNPSKTLAYLLMFFAIPYIGILVYFVFGENYRKNKLYKKKWLTDRASAERFGNYMVRLSEQMLREHMDTIEGNAQLVRLLVNDSKLPLSVNNRVRVLHNGEEKFPAVFEALEHARDHIHIEYYIFENGRIAEKLLEVLTRKCREGVIVRFIYDDFGSTIGRAYLNDLRAAGVQIYPFFKVYFHLLANRNNYRDHRKIIIVDGIIGFTGGINISDRYYNEPLAGGKTFWRDTHLRLEGDCVKLFQYLFFQNWNFCCDDKIDLTMNYFPDYNCKGNQLVQVAYSGPDSDRASIMLSYFAAINNSREYVYITTPYFIPNESILNALKNAALSKVDVRLIVPGVSDSKFVNAAARSYYEELLEAGVRIFLYRKGFIHSKTLIADHSLSMVGTANMDIRSFDLNFEVNAVVFDTGTHRDLKNAFMADLKDSVEIGLEQWRSRPRLRKMFESSCRLLSALL
ncbi:MAG: cardiolipin synthase [Chitinophagaceae bacterium]|nr:MAG: cardiolipin synthase [Chitinophagaceae bacterium]